MIHVKKRRRILKRAKGFKLGQRHKIKEASTAIKHAGVHAYVGRKKKKRIFRKLWQVRLAAVARQNGISYSQFINKLHKAKIGLDRKILADLAQNEPKIFAQIVKKIK